MTGGRKSLLCAASVSVTTIAMAAAAHAASPSNAQANTATGGELEEVVVTAQRRAQNQQEVPIAITTLTAESAGKFGASSTETLTYAVPSLTFTRQAGSGVTPFLRGVGSSESTGAESEIALFIDDVYIANSAATDLQFNNIESIEVLKGPQGTLFGRNATGGVIHIHTRQPSQDGAAELQVGYGSFDTIYGNMYLTGGLSDTISVSLAATGRDQREGYGKSLTTGKDTLLGWNYGVRGMLSWEPSEMTKLLLSGEFSDSRSDAGASFVIAPGTVSVGGGTAPADPYDTNSAPGDTQKIPTYRFSAKLTHDFSATRLVSISSYADTDHFFYLDLDENPVPLDILHVDVKFPSHGFSQEVQLQSPESNEKLSWILGAFYFKYFVGLNPQRLGGFVAAPLGGFRDLFALLNLESYSAFADATYAFTPETKLSLGARYTNDEYEMRFGMTSPVLGEFGVLPDQKKSWSEPTWRAVLEHHFTPDVMAYVSNSRGFKSGRFNVSDGSEIAPETLDSYEVGIKTEWADNRLRLNAAAFHYKYKDIQVSQNVGGVNQVRNAAEATLMGADLDISYEPTRNLNITGGIAWLDTEYDSFPNGPFNVANPATCDPPQSVGPPTGGFTTCSVELAGNSLPQAPKFAANLAVTLTVPMSSGDLSLNAAVYHNDGFFWEPDNRLTQPSYDLVNASIGWSSQNGKFYVQAYGRNLLDEYYSQFMNSGALGALSSPAMPRNYGIEFGTRL